MSKFIENVNEYLKRRQIKNNYITLMTGWDKSKVSRILNSAVDLKLEEAELLADVLGHDLQFFLGDLKDMEMEEYQDEQIALFAGNLTHEDRMVAESLIEMFRFYDALTSVSL